MFTLQEKQLMKVLYNYMYDLIVVFNEDFTIQYQISTCRDVS